MKALIISADNFEDSELLVPYYRLKEAGAEVTMASLSGGVIRGKHSYEVIPPALGLIGIASTIRSSFSISSSERV